MWTYLLKRLLLMFVTLFGVTVVNFVIIHLAPAGRPGGARSAEDLQRGLTATGQLSNEEQFRKEYKLNKPIILNTRPFSDYSDEVGEGVGIRASAEAPALWESLADLRERSQAGEDLDDALDRVESYADRWNLKTLADAARYVAVDLSWYELYDLYRGTVTTVAEEARKRAVELERWVVPHLYGSLLESRDPVLGFLVVLVAGRHYPGEPWALGEGDRPDEILAKLRQFETWWKEESGGQGRPGDGSAARWLDEAWGTLYHLDLQLQVYLRLKTLELFAEERLDLKGADVPADQRKDWEDRRRDHASKALAKKEEMDAALTGNGVALDEARLREELLRDRARTLDTVRWRILQQVARAMVGRGEQQLGRAAVGELAEVYLRRRDPQVLTVVVNSLAQILEAENKYAIFEDVGSQNTPKRVRRWQESAAEKVDYWEDRWAEEKGEYEYSALEKVRDLFADTQYANYMSRIVRLDLGRAIRRRNPFAVVDLGKAIRQDNPEANDLIWEHFQVSFLLMLVSDILIYAVAIPVGIFSAVRQRSIPDMLATVVLFVLYSIPSYVAAVFLILWFAAGRPWKIFPTDRLHGTDADKMTTIQYVLDAAHHMVLPVFCLTYGALASVSRYARVGMLDVIRQDYVRTARAKGLPERVVILKHALRNGLIPLITIFSSLLPILVSGSVIIETIFSIQGMGYLAFHSIFEKDYTTLMGINLITAVLVMVGILISDFLYAVVDPQITFD
ncbi:MAG: ABC transporter permease subunit [Planctomycetes bacterium]|nr:ABC transporter permease subunit [Planctomycetota bacterium]